MTGSQVGIVELLDGPVKDNDTCRQFLVFEERPKSWEMISEEWRKLPNFLRRIGEFIELGGTMNLFERVGNLINPVQNLNFLFPMPAIVPMVERCCFFMILPVSIIGELSFTIVEYELRLPHPERIIQLKANIFRQLAD